MTQCLGDPSKPVRNAAASAVSAIAKIELPIGLWDDLFENLGNVIMNTSIDSGPRVACIETVRYICEDLTNMNDALSSTIMHLLLNILSMQQPPEIVSEAVYALSSALTFADSYLSDSSEFLRLMQSLLNACQSSSLEVQVQGFDCLNIVFDQFYTKIEPFFKEFYAACETALCSDVPELSIRGALTLCTLLDVELEQEQMGEKTLQLGKQYGEKLAGSLCSVMVKQEEEDTGETMTPAAAAATCLRALAEVLRNGSGERADER